MVNKTVPDKGTVYSFSSQGIDFLVILNELTHALVA